MAEVEHYADLNAAITKESGAPLVLKWLVLAEVVSDGGRQMMSISSEDCLDWDQLGMVEHHRAFVHARQEFDG